MADTKKISVPIIGEREYHTTMSHFYRGEMGRMMVWRQRLDVTSNWAVVCASAIITLGLGNAAVSHTVFVVANLLVFLLLAIEGRRYQYFDAFHSRVRMLECHFLAPTVARYVEELEGDWRMLLAEDLLIPSFKISISEAIGRRLTQTYIWIFLILGGSWILKVLLHEQPINSFMDFLATVQRTQPLPPSLFWIIVLAFYAMLAWYLLCDIRNQLGATEVQRPAPNRDLWRI
jgi:uncharacterized membrane protein